MALDRGDDDLGGKIKETLVKSAHQNHGPLHQTCGFLCEGRIFDQLQTALCRQARSLLGNHRNARFRLQHHEGRLKLHAVIFKAGHHNRFAVAHETMAERVVACGNSAHLKFNHLAIEQTQDGVKRTHPAQTASAPAHGFGPGKLADHLGHQFRDDGRGGPALGFNQCDVKGAFFLIDPLLALLKGDTGRAQKALYGLFRRVGARAFALFAHVWLRCGKALD